MRRERASKSGRVVSILAAGAIGYLLGGWNTTALRGTNLSPAQTVALRFPEDQYAAVTSTAALGAPQPTTAAPAAAAPNAMVLGNAKFALLSPNPMAPLASAQAAEPAVAPVEAAAPSPPDAALPPRPESAAKQPAADAKSAAVQVRRANRPGFVLNDAQIASIKRRLNLTPEQERMWPAVEAALRNLAYAKARYAHRRGRLANTAAAASLDPESTEVQDLKSAATPLIMSFNDEQKNEVRSLVHVMGLDRLASEF